MRAVLMTAAGGPEVLQTVEREPPGIGTGRELLIRVRAAGVNPIDTKLRKSGTLYPDRMPAVLGCDGAGIIEQVGEQVSMFGAGDEVYFCSGGIGGDPGTYAELTVVDERFAAPKPQSLSFAEAAAAPLVLITAWESLYDLGELAEGERVLVHAGAGGVGHVAVQLARLRGARVCATVGSEEKGRFVHDLGAEEAILYRQDDFVQAARAWSAGQGVDLALDTVGGKTFYRSLAAVRPYGRVVTLLLPEAESGDWKEARLRNLRVGFEWMLAPMLQGPTARREHHGEILRHCGRWFDAGLLRVHLGRTFALEEAGRAHALLEQGSMTGKIALLVSG
ncbi:MAG: zinc-dependent alcohol dehydrogenase family protein [bacterium]